MTTTLKTFRNTRWTSRNYECTNIVACQAPAAPADHWEECEAEILNGLTDLWREGDVRLFGYL